MYCLAGVKTILFKLIFQQKLTHLSKIQYFQKLVQMSGKFSSTGTAFGSSNVFRQEQFIRQIVQNEVLSIFEDIKVQIQSKIKSIDKNIYELRSEVRRINQINKTHQDLSEVLAKIEKIQAQVQLLRYHQQFQLKNSRAKSLDKDRKPIFRKNSGENQDFSSIVLGLQIDSKHSINPKIKEKPQIMVKPPLPREAFGSRDQQNTKGGKKVQSQAANQRRNMILQDSGTIHRWVSENNNKQFSCFGQIIRQEDIEESVFH